MLDFRNIIEFKGATSIGLNHWFIIKPDLTKPIVTPKNSQRKDFGIPSFNVSSTLGSNYTYKYTNLAAKRNSYRLGWISHARIVPAAEFLSLLNKKI